jgi:hypothetical protein
MPKNFERQVNRREVGRLSDASGLNNLPVGATQPMFAACPPIDSCFAALKPRYFGSKPALNRFLNSEIRPVSAAREAQLTGRDVNEILGLRTQRHAARTKERAQILEQIRSGERSPWAFPPNLRKITHYIQGWRDVPVRHYIEHPDLKSNYSLTDFLPRCVEIPVIDLSLEEEFHRAERGFSGAFMCCLGKDWRFAEIEADFKEKWHSPARVNHGHASVGEIVIEFVYFLDTSFRKFHPNATNETAASFWSSWQVQEVITRFCARLYKSRTAEMLTGNAFAAEMEVARAKVFVFECLSELSRNLSEHYSSMEKKAPQSAQIPSVTTAGEANRRIKVDAFLLKCNQEPDLAVELRRKHIHLAVGHKTPRQFQRWQSGSSKATPQDHQNFTRILDMPASEFVALLRRLGAVP